MKLSISRLFKDRSGNVGLLFGVVAVPLFAAVGMALDYSNMLRMRHDLANALDATALAAATSAPSEMQQIANDVFAANFDSASYGVSLTPTITVSGEALSASANVDYSSIWMISSKRVISGFSQVRLADTQNAEIVFVLDYSSSMNSMYAAMRDASVSLVKTLTKNMTSTDVKIGLVPFGAEVYTTMDGKNVLGGTTGVPWSNCTISRKWPWVWKDNSPTAAKISQWGRTDSDDTIDSDEYDDCPNYPSRNLTVRELTTDHVGTVAQLEAMVPYEGTNVALGIEFGYQLISNEEPFTGAVDFGEEGWRKFIVLLTDGRHNKKGFGPGTIYTADQGRQNLQLICSELKKKGVEVITIAYDLDDSEGKAELEQCATNSNYYLEGDEDSVAEVFGTVGRLVSTVYLTK